MSELGNNGSISVELYVAYRAVNYGVIATVSYTIGSYVILGYRSSLGVTESGENLFLGLITMLTYICCQTVIYTGRSNYGNIP